LEVTGERVTERTLAASLGLEDEARRPGTKKGMARWAADCAVDRIRYRFGWDAIGYASVALGISPSVPDEFRKLAEKATQQMMTTGPTPKAGRTALVRIGTPPLGGAGEANLGYTELMRGKAACHSVGPILRRSAVTRSG
jgi:hypothetical protein